MLITSLNNKNTVLWHKLKQVKYQREYHKFIIEEKILIDEAIKNNLPLEIIALVDSEIEADYYVSENVMRKISHNVSLNEVVAVVDFFEVVSSDPKKIIFLDKLQDPGNVGSIIRSAKAFGYDKVVLSNSVNKYNHKLISASKGAIFSIEVVDDLTLKELKDDGYFIIGTLLDKSALRLNDVSKVDKFVVVFGNEGSGISDENLFLLDEKVYIEMDDFDSLNVSVSAGIILNHLR